MPENDKQDVQTQATEPNTPAETKKQKFERERLSRRAALRKMGVTSGMALFAMFSVDDLAHMVGKAMKQRQGDNKLAEQVARELSQAGVAMASGPSSACQNCVTSKLNCLDSALANEEICLSLSYGSGYCSAQYGGYVTGCDYAYAECCRGNHCNC